MQRQPLKPASGGVLNQLKETTPARIGVGRAGARPTTAAWLDFRQDHAMARDAVKSELDEAFVRWAIEQGFPVVQSLAKDKHDFIAFPPKGKRVSEETIDELKKLCVRGKDIQIVISDGLSAKAIESNIGDLLPMVLDGLELERFTYGTPIVVKYGRVAVADQLTHELGAKVAINLIGERPGLSAADSLSAYITYNAGPDTISSDRTVVSNIHERGTLPVEAGAYIVQLVKRIMTHKVSGVRLQQIS